MHETSDHPFAAEKEFSHSVLNPSQVFFHLFPQLAMQRALPSSFLKVEIFRPADG
jgi:hypothetical protein